MFYSEGIYSIGSEVTKRSRFNPQQKLDYFSDQYGSGVDSALLKLVPDDFQNSLGRTSDEE